MTTKNETTKTKKVEPKTGCKRTCKKTQDKKPIFTKDSTLGEVIQKKPESEAILLGFGMHCFGCFVSQMETLEEAAEVHGIELEFLLKKLNEL